MQDCGRDGWLLGLPLLPPPLPRPLDAAAAACWPRMPGGLLDRPRPVGGDDAAAPGSGRDEGDRLPRDGPPPRALLPMVATSADATSGSRWDVSIMELRRARPPVTLGVPVGDALAVRASRALLNTEQHSTAWHAKARCVGKAHARNSDMQHAEVRKGDVRLWRHVLDLYATYSWQLIKNYHR